MNRIFVVPKNDAEAVRIVEILKEKGENVLITSQSWGASWDKLEDEIKKQITEIWKQYQLSVGEKIDIYGIELQGKSPNILCKNIDHHCYAEEDRSNEKSSLEQVADIIDYKLTDYDKMISANDTGYIPAMQSLDIDITEDDRKYLIIKVRKLDRQAQGITKEQEEQSDLAIQNLKIIGDLTMINSPHSKCSCYTDKLYGKYTNMIVFSEDGETNYYGNSDTVNKLFETFQGWKGGNLDNGYGFWGGYSDQKLIEKIVKEG